MHKKSLYFLFLCLSGFFLNIHTANISDPLSYLDQEEMPSDNLFETTSKKNSFTKKLKKLYKKNPLTFLSCVGLSTFGVLYGTNVLRSLYTQKSKSLAINSQATSEGSSSSSPTTESSLSTPPLDHQNPVPQDGNSSLDHENDTIIFFETWSEYAKSITQNTVFHQAVCVLIGIGLAKKCAPHIKKVTLPKISLRKPSFSMPSLFKRKSASPAKPSCNSHETVALANTVHQKEPSHSLTERTNILLEYLFCVFTKPKIKA